MTLIFLIQIIFSLVGVLAFTSLAAGLASAVAQSTAYTATAGAPVAGNLLVCVVVCKGNTTPGTLSGGGWNWTRLTFFTSNGGADIVSIWYAPATGITSTAPSYLPASAATGCFIHCYRVTGAEGQTQMYIRQLNTNSGTTANPTVVMSVAPLTGNGMIACALNNTNSTTQWTTPTSFINAANVAAAGGSLYNGARASGQTSATITWTCAASTWTTFGIEFYVAGTGPVMTSGNGENGFFGLAPSY
jgi:hypothetical protein